MPALQKPPARLPRFVPHIDSGANAGAGTLFPTQHISGIAPGPRSVPVPETVPARPENLDRLAHDVRNVLSSLMLYSDLLSAPGVLSRDHGHIAPELEGLAKAAAQLMELILDRTASPQPLPARPLPAPSSVAPEPAALPIATPAPLPTLPVTDLAAELRHLQPLLAAIAGPAVKLSIATMPCSGRTELAIEDLTRILVNLVRNAADAMPSGGRIRVTAQYGSGHSFLDPESSAAIGPPRSVVLSVIDNGPGIPEHLRGQVFDFGFTTRTFPSLSDDTPGPEWPAPRRRGLGLNIVRNLVESAGGTIRIAPSSGCGTHFEIVLPLSHPVTSGMYATPPNSAFATDSAMKGRLECR